MLNQLIANAYGRFCRELIVRVQVSGLHFQIYDDNIRFKKLTYFCVARSYIGHLWKVRDGIAHTVPERLERVLNSFNSANGDVSYTHAMEQLAWGMSKAESEQRSRKHGVHYTFEIDDRKGRLPSGFLPPSRRSQNVENRVSQNPPKSDRKPGIMVLSFL